MLIGMGMVFAFLALLVITIRVMSSVVNRFFPNLPNNTSLVHAHSEDPGIIAAIAAAVHQYRTKYPKN